MFMLDIPITVRVQFIVDEPEPEPDEPAFSDAEIAALFRAIDRGERLFEIRHCAGDCTICAADRIDFQTARQALERVFLEPVA